MLTKLKKNYFNYTKHLVTILHILTDMYVKISVLFMIILTGLSLFIDVCKSAGHSGGMYGLGTPSFQ